MGGERGVPWEGGGEEFRGEFGAGAAATVEEDGGVSVWRCGGEDVEGGKGGGGGVPGWWRGSRHGLIG